MPTSKCRALTFLWLLLFPLTAVPAQDANKPLAVLKQSADGGAFFIRVQTNVRLPVGSRLSAILSNKNSLVSWQEDVADCPAQVAGKFCKRLDETGLLELDFPVARKPQAGDKFKISFAIIDDTGKGSFRTVDLLPNFKATGPRKDLDCSDGLIVDVVPDTEWPLEGDDVPYYEQRIRALDAWLKANQSAPQDMAKVRIEPLTRTGVVEYIVRSFSVAPGISGGTNAQEIDVEGALSFQKVSMCLKFDKKLPDERFNAEIAFANKPPAELERALVKTLSGAKAMAPPNAANIPEEKELNLRSFENNLNLGLLYTSSVRDVRRGNRTFRERQSRGALDLRFAPLLRHRTGTPEVRKWQPFWTPVFLDGKVSTGKIADDSLSLNRILLGTEVTFRYYQSAQRGKRNKYLLTLRGVNASDRDYKRAEIRSELEFRPIFDALNQPLRLGSHPEDSILLPDGPQKEIPPSGFFGYQIEPFIGLEAGRVYRHSRAALKNEEKSDNLRRLLFGADMLFSLSRHVNLRLSDTFYLRGSVTGGRTRNYFNAVVEVPLRNLSRNAAQSIFFSFERGDLPPFATPSVNALKFGYRVRSDFFAGGPSR